MSIETDFGGILSLTGHGDDDCRVRDDVEGVLQLGFVLGNHRRDARKEEPGRWPDENDLKKVHSMWRNCPGYWPAVFYTTQEKGLIKRNEAFFIRDKYCPQTFDEA